MVIRFRFDCGDFTMNYIIQGMILNEKIFTFLNHYANATPWPDTVNIDYIMLYYKLCYVWLISFIKLIKNGPKLYTSSYQTNLPTNNVFLKEGIPANKQLHFRKISDLTHYHLGSVNKKFKHITFSYIHTYKKKKQKKTNT